MEIILTCNGEHINTHCTTLGHCNDRLSEKGILESLRLAQALKDEKIDFIFCSDIGFRRTTTDLVFSTLTDKGFKIIVDPNIRELWAEICTNLTKENLEKLNADDPEQTAILNRLFIKTDTIEHSQTRDENHEQVYDRCKLFINELTKRYPSNAKILIVGNPIVNSILITLLLKRKWEESKYISIPCSISRLQYRENKRALSSFNQTSHLHWRLLS